MPLASYSPQPRPVNNTAVDMNNRLAVHLDNNTNWLNAVNNHRQRAVGGGWNSTEIADRAILSQNLFPTAKANRFDGQTNTSVSFTGTTTISTDGVPINVPFGSAVFIWAQMTLTMDTADRAVTNFMRVDRSTSNTFASTSTVRGTVADKVFNFDGKGETCTSAFYLDTTSKPAGIYYYRITASLTNQTPNPVTITPRFQNCTLSYLITNGVA